VARRRPAAGSAGGGAVVQAPRAVRTRLILGGVALACELGVVGHVAARGGAWAEAGAALGAALALLLALAVVFRAAALVPWSLFGVGALYAATLRGGLDGWAIAVGAALGIAAELAYWAIEDEPRLRPARDVTLRRIATIAALVAATGVAGVIVLAAAGLEVGAGLPLALAGAVAAAGLLVLVARLARAAGATSSSSSPSWRGSRRGRSA
jgi:hypothetical protein